MNDGNKEKKGGLWQIVGLTALIVVLFVGIKLVFAGLEAAIPQDGSGSQSVSQSVAEEDPQTEDGEKAPAFCPFCGEGLPDSFQWGQYCPWCGKQVEA